MKTFISFGCLTLLVFFCLFFFCVKCSEERSTVHSTSTNQNSEQNLKEQSINYDSGNSDQNLKEKSLEPEQNLKEELSYPTQLYSMDPHSLFCSDLFALNLLLNCMSKACPANDTLENCYTKYPKLQSPSSSKGCDYIYHAPNCKLSKAKILISLESKEIYSGRCKFLQGICKGTRIEILEDKNIPKEEVFVFGGTLTKLY